MAVISAFADEIDPSLDVQMDVCASHGIHNIDVRGIDGVNVSKFTASQAREYRKRMKDRGFHVPCVGSPLGKIRIDEDLQAHLELTRHCCDLANAFAAPYVRIFSFYGPKGGNIADHRPAVMEMLEGMTRIAEEAGVILLHENEKNIFGARPDGVKDILNTVRSDHFLSLFDPSNFLEENLAPYEDCWQMGLAEVTHYFHIKDKVKVDDPTCVPAGEGSAKVEAILADAKRRGFDGFLTLEPHMQKVGQFAGFSGPERFGRAVAGLKKICDKIGLEYE